MDTYTPPTMTPLVQSQSQRESAYILAACLVLAIVCTGIRLYGHVQYRRGYAVGHKAGALETINTLIQNAEMSDD